MKTKLRWLGSILVGALLIWIGRTSVPRAPESQGAHDHAAAEEASAGEEIWTCPMHAQIRMPKPGKCPICGMDLVKLTQGDDTGPRRMMMSPDAVRLARLRTDPVEYRYVTHSVRLVGKLTLDETAVKTISAWVPGRIDRLFVDYTGVEVQKGEHLFELYSPDLLTAQQELLSARERLESVEEDASEFLRASTERAYQSAREKLSLWGLADPQIDQILERGTAADRITIHSPTAGTVIRRHRDQGDYVQTGTAVYDIADLHHLWVQLDAYEQDLPWIRFGQEVTLQAEALPGEVFHGTVTFIDPVVNEMTRTIGVRVNVSNPKGRLKPGMFVHAVVDALLGEEGAIVPADLAGKWICPMHPEIIEETPGRCRICGMDLVPAEELDLPGAGAEPAPALVVPSSAVLVTGKRAVVYVEVPGSEKPTYEGREILLGPRAEDGYIVRAGLTEGERVVTNGAFRLDSSMQIRAKPSMLSEPADSPASGPSGEPFRATLAPFYQAYFDLTAALAADDEAKARGALEPLREALTQARPELLPQPVRKDWKALLPGLEAALAGAAKAGDIEDLRAAYDPLSRRVIALARTFGVPAGTRAYEAFCPMAFDSRGALWLQPSKGIHNPYFGQSMPGCGELRETFIGNGAASGTEAQHGGHTANPPQAGRAVDAEEAALYDAYLAIAGALAEDRPASAEQLEALIEAAKGVDEKLSQAAAALQGDLEAQRSALAPLSELLLAHLAEGNRSGRTLHKVHCPMAFDDGADWISAQPKVRNPYFGSDMPGCGSIEETFEAEGK